MGTFINGHAMASPDSQERFVGTPYMNAMGRYLAQSLTITTQLRVATISHHYNQFHLHVDGWRDIYRQPGISHCAS